MKTTENVMKPGSSLQADKLTDLPIIEKQADAIKGGPQIHASDLANWQSNYGASH